MHGSKNVNNSLANVVNLIIYLSTAIGLTPGQLG